MKIRTIISPAVAAFLIFFSLVTSALAADKIAVLVSSKDVPFEEALKGFQGYLDKAAVQAEYEVHKLDGSAAKAGQAAQAVKKSGARLVLTLGSLATDAAVKEIPDIPIVACMVLRTDGLKKTPNVTGVGLEFSLEVQTSWLQVLLPTAKNVGVLYNPDENKMRIEAAGRIMQNMGLKLVAQEVRSPQEVPAALEGLAKKVDVLWGMADTVAMTPQTAKIVLPFSVRNNIPLIAPSPTWVKAGALYALEWDYADVGAQAGDMAVKILKGAPPAMIPTASPRKVYYALNLKTAQQMNITFSDQLLRGARHTFTGEK
ncbi:MAG TPA: ABC transporter substrate-binding protein [Nitrospirota bacterium]|nr:ABC transporter substrate-binding protein [Nitrospirota bacterium]